MFNQHIEVAVIGAGPAGLAAGMQLTRYGLEVLVFEEDCVGGLLRNANLVENYPGFPGGISGKTLVRLMEQQATLIGVRILPGSVELLECVDGTFQLDTTAGQYTAKYIVVATGTTPIKLQGVVITPEANPFVYYEVADLLSPTGSHVVIIGAGDAAFDYALSLCGENCVTILNHGQEIKSLSLLLERASAQPNITYRENTQVTHVALSGKTEANLELTCKTLQGEVKLSADFLVAAIGRQPALDYLSDNVREHRERLEEQGKLHIIGDVRNKKLRQTAIAAGDGIKAAMKIYEKVQGK